MNVRKDIINRVNKYIVTKNNEAQILNNMYNSRPIDNQQIQNNILSGHENMPQSIATNKVEVDNQQKVDKLNPENINVKEAIENAITAVGVLKTILTKLNLGGVESANNLIKRLEDIILPFDPSNKYIGKIGEKLDTPLKEDEQDRGLPTNFRISKK